MPNKAKFIGFVIYIPESDEFVRSINEDKYLKLFEFVQTPYLEKIFKRYDKAIRMAKKYNTLIGYLFETYENFTVGYEE